MLKTHEIRIRDPFVLAEAKTKTYYLFGTTDENVWQGQALGFDYYTSKDLENWAGPFVAFRPEESFWADHNFWAPEVHYYQGNYYMFASFKAENRPRGTQILKATQPDGPYLPLTDFPVTPNDKECLDGTLYVDKENNPWIVFCWEWTQVGDGKICAQRLTKDLRYSEGEPIVLFSASEASWTKQARESEDIYVTDGPFLYNENGQLQMIWSSFSKYGYAVGISRSISNDITGPWEHSDQVLLEKDGGHGMIFNTFSGERMLTIHSPNQTRKERPIFIKI